MSTDLDIQTPAVRPLTRWESFRLRAGLATGAGLGLVGAASAAVDFSNISSLLQAVVSLVPDFTDLVIGIAPLIVTIAIITFIVGLLESILGVIKRGV